jgi:hypothetical protein
MAACPPLAAVLHAHDCGRRLGMLAGGLEVASGQPNHYSCGVECCTRVLHSAYLEPNRLLS